MFKNFEDWVTWREVAMAGVTDRIEDAILGVVAGTDPVLGAEEKKHLLGRSATEFSTDILDRLQNLGIIRNLEPSLYQNVLQAIQHGVTIADLIEKVRGTQ